MPLLTEVLDLAQTSGGEVRLNIELKLETVPGRTAPREEFVRGVVPLLVEAGMVGRTTIESFDWGALMQVHRAEPGLGVVALTDGRHFGGPGESASWSGGLEVPDIVGYVAAAATFGAVAISPEHTLVTAELVGAAHRAGQRVIPWTVDDPTTLRALIAMGVDGVITNRPDVARRVLAAAGLPLPVAQPVIPA